MSSSQVADRIIGTGPNTGKKFAKCGIPDLSSSKAAHQMLHPYVRRNGPEGDYHRLTPLEFHADTSELVQMLQKGHHGVQLDQDAWDRLITWIDLNAPYLASWSEAGADPQILARRQELRKKYAADEFDPEKVVEPYVKPVKYVVPKPRERAIVPPQPAVIHNEKQESLEFDLGDGVTMKLVTIPAGAFSMGSNQETEAEQPVCRVKIDKPFFMGATEVTLEQYRQFDPEYLNGVDDMLYQGLAGILPDAAAPGFKKPVVRPVVVGDVTWAKAHSDSPYGRIVSNWKLEGGELVMDVTIPPNTTATIYVPAKAAAGVIESGKPAAKAEGVKFLRMDGGAAVYEVGSGVYHFQSTAVAGTKSGNDHPAHGARPHSEGGGSQTVKGIS